MENQKDIRWKQRFQNFEKAFLLFSEAVLKFESLDKLSKEGLIQRFEYTFELAWKLLKDFLEAEGVISKFPRDVLKKAFQYEIIDDGEIWLEMLEKRNLLGHTYDEENFELALKDLKDKYFEQIRIIYVFFGAK